MSKPPVNKDPHKTGAEKARPGDRIAKLLARAGIASRREVERMIEEGRISLDGVVITAPSTVLDNLKGITVDGQPVKAAEATRIFAFHKPDGLITAERDPAGRPTIYTALRNALPPGTPRVMPIGRLDFNTEGLLLLTNDGELKRKLELPSTGIPRTYRARTFGDITQAQLEELSVGIEIDGMRYGSINANMERSTGRNQWIEVTITEGKNREVRRVLEHLGLQVSRLLRTAYGPIPLADLPRGAAVEIRPSDVERFVTALEKGTALPGPGAYRPVELPVVVAPPREAAPAGRGRSAPAYAPRGSDARPPRGDDSRGPRARVHSNRGDLVRDGAPADRRDAPGRGRSFERPAYGDDSRGERAARPEYRSNRTPDSRTDARPESRTDRRPDSRRDATPNRRVDGRSDARGDRRGGNYAVDGSSARRPARPDAASPAPRSADGERRQLGVRPASGDGEPRRSAAPHGDRRPPSGKPSRPDRAGDDRPRRPFSGGPRSDRPGSDRPSSGKSGPGGPRSGKPGSGKPSPRGPRK
jgi:23S rRNA pseudouridine2605 synthase